MGVGKMSKNRKYTTLPCGMKLRLNVETGGFDLVGNLGKGLPDKIHLDIVSTSTNLMAVLAFFLAQVQESRELERASD